jgi:hypothetical protein
MFEGNVRRVAFFTSDIIEPRISVGEVLLASEFGLWH